MTLVNIYDSIIENLLLIQRITLMISVIVVDTRVRVFVLVLFVVMQDGFMFTRIAQLVGVIDGKRRISL